MRITAIVGSARNNGSCYNIIKKIKDELQQTNFNLNFNTIILSEHNIQFCKGCMNCFSKHRCLINDDVSELSRKLLDSDIIIISTPVYFQGPSAILKNFMDRLSFWTHTMELSGKLGVIITCSHNNGNKETSDYILKYFNYLGLLNISTLNYEGISSNSKNFMKQLNRAIQKINIYDNLEYIKTSIEQQNIFDYYKNKYKDSIKDYYFKSEVTLWKEIIENNLTFDEYFNYKRSLQKAGDKNDREQNIFIKS